MRSGRTIGAILLAKSGHVAVFGPLSDPRLGAMVLERKWLAEIKRRRIATLSLDGKSYTIFCIPTDAGELLLFNTGVGDALTTFLATVDFAFDALTDLIDDPDCAMTVIDREGRLSYLSPRHETFFGTDLQGGLGGSARDVIGNTQLDRVLGTGKAERGDVQNIDGVSRPIVRIPVSQDGKVVGAIGRIALEAPDEIEGLTRRINELERDVAFFRRLSGTGQVDIAGEEAIIGGSDNARRVRMDAAKAAPLGNPVLIRGEAGTDTAQIAYAIHRTGPRREGPFVIVNAAALPSSMLEIELFGCELGAIPGADKKAAKGAVERANDGTLFIEGVSTLSLSHQQALLDALQRREVMRIGAAQGRKADVRLIAASSRNLHGLVESGAMLPAFLDRISPIVIDVAPLRGRLDDLPDLLSDILKAVAMRHHHAVPAIADDVVPFLKGQGWPGNDLELRQAVERAFAVGDGETLRMADFVPRRGRVRSVDAAVAPTGSGLHAATEALGMDLIYDALERCGGNKKKAAAQLGISRSYLYKRLAEAKA
ncbi:AAA family ATPase [Hwanghaeella grinnelliae]|uniref:AAA family ATPase n=1 Tax=Hwanghaeella grinnelliae TaxID=2500179 RepID=A0A437QHQ1_9PROT|nr:sigma 54-interacting transcriptional regulator [Hwanghaeella grinnelliae]RVU34061.1 AAA family ATPase [Hwanghaeella grinnelliae]